VKLFTVIIVGRNKLKFLPLKFTEWWWEKSCLLRHGKNYGRKKSFFYKVHEQLTKQQVTKCFHKKTGIRVRSYLTHLYSIFLDLLKYHFIRKNKYEPIFVRQLK